MGNLKNKIYPLFVFLFIIVIQNAFTDFTWTTSRQWSRLAEGRELTVLSGGATITSDATTIIADEIELWGTDFRYSMARGGVTASDTERGIVLKSDTLFYDREEEIIRVDGFIDMQDLKNEVVVRGGFFEYFGKEEIAYIQIGVRILKVDEDTDLACRSEFARYNRKDGILELSGMPRVTRNDDLYSAAKITINLDTDEILLDRDVSGTLVTDSAEKAETDGRAVPDQLPILPELSAEETTPDESTGPVPPEVVEETEVDTPETEPVDRRDADMPEVEPQAPVDTTDEATSEESPESATSPEGTAGDDGPSATEEAVPVPKKRVIRELPDSAVPSGEDTPPDAAETE